MSSASNHMLEINCTLLGTLFSKKIIWGSSTLTFFQKLQMKIIKRCKTLVLFQYNHSGSECLPLVKNVLFPTLFISSGRIGKFITFSIWLWKVFPSPLFTNEVLWLWNATNHLSFSTVDINLICDTSHMFVNIILISTQTY